MIVLTFFGGELSLYNVNVIVFNRNCVHWYAIDFINSMLSAR